MDNKPEIEQPNEDESTSDSVQSSWPPPILPDCEDPASVKPSRSLIEKVKAESKILGRFAVAGMLYGFIVAFLCFDATTFRNPLGFNLGIYLLEMSVISIIPALLIGIPLGLIAGVVFGLLRRTNEAWTLVGFALGGGISLLTYFSRMTFAGGVAKSTSSIIMCTLPALLTTILSEALRRDYNSAHQRMPLVARLKELDSEHQI